MQAIGGADVLRSRDRDDVARICNIQEVALSGIALATSDCLSREVFGVLGVPVDALDLSTLVGKIDSAVGNGAPFFVSTPNVNWLMTSRKSHEFREALLFSDICPADGMPIVWIARLLGLPIRTRLAGSDLFDTLKARSRNGRRMRVFLFGGSEDAATKVGEILNTANRQHGMRRISQPGIRLRRRDEHGSNH